MPCLIRLLSRFRPPPGWWLGTASRVTIAPAGWGGGYVVMLHRTQGVEWIFLPPRTRVYDRPDEREFFATSQALTARGLTWVLPWELDRGGNLTAPVTTSDWKEDHR